ncbi:hypothetical protein BD780_001200 [Clostridium tetanomorphum]|nr:hypothetical protein [Clostridium tetanomorphum]NRS83975.1 hypothetical protein [Clostridium tetanomorphum]
MTRESGDLPKMVYGASEGSETYSRIIFKYIFM